MVTVVAALSAPLQWPLVADRQLSPPNEDRGLDPRTIADRHDLGVADVYRALTDYHDNPAEMRAVERERTEAVDDHEHLTTDPADVRD